MKHYQVPVVLVDADGRELRFPSGKDAGAFLNTTSGNVMKAAMIGYKCRGYRVYRAEDYDREEEEP